MDREHEKQIVRNLIKQRNILYEKHGSHEAIDELDKLIIDRCTRLAFGGTAANIDDEMTGAV